MQPTIIFTAPIPGMIYLNGRFAGEASADHPLFAPVAPFGAVYMEYHPLIAGHSSLAWKCVFSGGSLLPDSIANAEGVSAVAWPGGILEIELVSPQFSIEHFFLADRPCSLSRGDETKLFIGSIHFNLPDNALSPRLQYIHNCPVLSGDIRGGGQYILTIDRDFSQQTGFLAADRIDFDGQDMLHASVSCSDLVGHGRLEQWLIDTDGLRRISSESVWFFGEPRWPQTAEDAMRAAIDAALLGLHDESEAYFSPQLRTTSPMSAISDICDLCIPMKYGLPDSRPCVGLMRMENEHLAYVRPLYYRAVMSGESQGPWAIDWISTE